VRIIRIDTERRRIGLSMRQAAEDTYVEVDWRVEAQASGVMGATPEQKLALSPVGVN
jgi:ribosomal protein S1